MDRPESSTVSHGSREANQRSNGSRVPRWTPPPSSSAQRSAVGGSRLRYNPESEISQEFNQTTRETDPSIVRPNKRAASQMQNARKTPRETPIANQHIQLGTTREDDDDASPHSFSLLRAAQSFAQSIVDIFTSPVKTRKTSDVTETALTFEPIPSRNGEENERNVFRGHAVLFFNVDGVWKTYGSGVVRINVDRKGKGRLIMRRDFTLGVLLNARLRSDMRAEIMSKDAVAFSCVVDDPDMQYEPNCEILALRFDTSDHSVAESFITTIELYKNARG